MTSLVIGYSHNDYEVSATVLAAIKTNNSKAGERGARTEWVWKEWQNDWTFRQESEVWGEARSIHIRPLLLIHQSQRAHSLRFLNY